MAVNEGPGREPVEPEDLDEVDPLDDELVAAGVGPLQRATRAARAEEPSGWSVLADDVKRRARTITRPDHPVLVRLDADGSRTVVSSRVLLAAVRRLLGSAPTHAPDDVVFRVDDERLLAVEVSLVAAFGVDLVTLAEDVRAQVLEEIGSIVTGEGTDAPPLTVDVAVVDVVDGDPRVL
ncbi:hypothetical protein GCM10009737_04200 [Nocardioides lentus]|uniref:Asp23/Gls24 family envelope stress response protein n=1 Tax=Nocardioides lentus TaxID=338077 RepID=A0ABP5A881_9ACTN